MSTKKLIIMVVRLKLDFKSARKRVEGHVEVTKDDKRAISLYFVLSDVLTFRLLSC